MSLKDELNDILRASTFEKFKSYFDFLYEGHEKCGFNCPHLRKYYDNIGFVPTRPTNRKVLDIPINVIKKPLFPTIPNINSDRWKTKTKMGDDMRKSYLGVPSDGKDYEKLKEGAGIIHLQQNSCSQYQILEINSYDSRFSDLKWTELLFSKRKEIRW